MGGEGGDGTEEIYMAHFIRITWRIRRRGEILKKEKELAEHS
jgi:hypothetical protein